MKGDGRHAQNNKVCLRVFLFRVRETEPMHRIRHMDVGTRRSINGKESCLTCNKLNTNAKFHTNWFARSQVTISKRECKNIANEQTESLRP